MSFTLKTAEPSHLQVEKYFRKLISCGQLKPGDRLLSNQEWAQKLGVSGTVIQIALGKLSQEGIVERRQKKGTFVRRRLTQANVAVLFGDSLSDESAHFYRAVLNRLQGIAVSKDWTCRSYDRLNKEMFSEKISTKQREIFLSDHQFHPTSGIIEFLPGTDTMIPPDLVGKVPTACWRPGSAASDLTLDLYDFGVQTVNQLAGMGCRNLLYFRSYWHNQKSTESIDGILDGVQTNDFPSPAIHSYAIKKQGYEMERDVYLRFKPILEAWTNGNAPSKPDALIFSDDIVLRAVAPALLAAGFSIPGEMKVACLGNEDVRFHYGFPVVRYEISPKAIAAHLSSLLEKRINGDPSGSNGLSLKGSIYIEK